MKRYLLIIYLLFIGSSCCQTKSELNVADYPDVKDRINQKRLVLGERYINAETTSEKLVIINEARLFLVKAITEELIPYWYGTKWDYNGTTQTPQKGKIACGYFVTTLLQDAGFNLKRVKLARLASERIIKNLTTEDHIKRFSNYKHIDEFLSAVKNWGNGLYVVGLDDHTGFILCDDDGVFFLHSSPNYPWQVVSEKDDKNPRLRNSGYRVLGKISEDDELIKKWLSGTKVSAKGN